MKEFGLIPGRGNSESQPGAHIIPNAVIIAPDDVEPVVSGSQVREYLDQIGEEAIYVGTVYHDSGPLRQATGHYALAVKTGAKKAPKLLGQMPGLKLTEFKAVPSRKPAAKRRHARRKGRRKTGLAAAHMTLSKKEPLDPGVEFEARVNADRSEAKPGEDSSPITLKGNYHLEVTLLASAHFVVNELGTKPFPSDPEKPETDTVPFDVTVKAAADLPGIEGPVSLCAVFTDRGRPAGMVRTSPSLAGMEPPAKDEDDEGEQPCHGTISLEAGASPADLNITVIAQAENDNRHFWCTVQTNLLPEYKKGVQEPWITNTSTKDIVKGYMESFAAESIDGFTRLTRLRGAGKKLFKGALPVFQEAFWKLIDSNIKFQTIQIVSSEPYYPWELMIPNRPRLAQRTRLPFLSNR